MKKLLAGALFLAIVASVYWFVVRREADAAREARADAVLVEFDDRAVQALRVRRGDSRGRFERADEGWRLIDPARDAADTEAIGRVLSALQGVEVLETLEEPAPLEEYSLDPPVVAIGLELDDRTVEIGVGSPTPDGRGLFVDAGEDDRVRIVDNLAQVLFVTTVDGLRDPSLPGVSRASVDRLTLDLGAEEGTFERRDGSWRLVEPFAVPARTPRIEALLDALYGAKVVKFLDGVRETSPDLFRRDASVRLEGVATRTVELGGSAGAGRRYAVRDDRETLLQVAFEEELPWPASLTELLADRWSELNRYDVREIRGTRPEGPFRLVRAESRWTREGAAVAEREVLEWLQAFLATPVEDWRRDDSPASGSHGVTLTLDSGATVQFTWTPGRGGRSSEAPGARAIFPSDPRPVPNDW